MTDPKPFTLEWYKKIRTKTLLMSCFLVDVNNQEEAEKYIRIHNWINRRIKDINDEGIRRSAEIARKRPYYFRMKTITR